MSNEDHEISIKSYIDTKFQGVENLLTQILNNTRETKDEVVEQEKRVRKLEQKQYQCPISQVEKKQEILERETKRVRAWATIMGGTGIIVLISFITLVLQYFQII